MTKIRILPVPLGGGVSPTGTLEIRSEGVFDVTDYAEVDVDIFDDTTTKTITNNGVYNAEDDNVLGYSQVTVNVPASAVDTGTKTTSITNNGTTTVDVVGYANNEITVNVPASAVDTGTKTTSITNNGTTTVDVIGYANNEITVNVPASAVDTGTKSITSNGTGIDVVGYAAVDVNVIPNLQSKTATPTTSQQTITADTPTYDGLSSVVVDAVTSAIDPNILSQNIRAGVTILGITGSYTGGAQINPQDFLHFTNPSTTDYVDLNLFTLGSISTEIYYSNDYTIPLENWYRFYSGISIAPSETIYLYGNNINGLCKDSSSYCTFTSNNNLEIAGNLTSLLNSEESNIIPAYCFYRLFAKQAGKYLRVSDFSNLVIPDSSIGSYSFSNMFRDNTVITTAPTLPANTLGNYCCYYMFGGCTSLVNAPALPATKLVYGCYQYMFAECTSLTTAPALPATTLENTCYQNMFNGCTSLTTAPALPATLKPYCYNYMFSGCTSLVNAPALPATKLEESCYNYMFSGCTSLVNAPALPATTLVYGCYQNMFNGCTSLTTAPALPATTLANNCYQNMFNGCTSLTTAPALPATTLANNCYQDMFRNCTSLTTAPALPATTLANNCYQNMFGGCTSLVNAPALPATTLASGCYSYMFRNCSSLNTITTHATTWEASYTTNWVQGVAATGDFYNLGQATNIPSGTNGIPSGWTEHTSLPNQFCIENRYAGNNDIILTKMYTPTGGSDLAYSTDGANWTTCTYDANNQCIIPTTLGGKVYFRSTTGLSDSTSNYYTITSQENFSASGDIRNLLDYTDTNLDTASNYSFYGLFKDSKIVDASNLDLSGITNLANYCYSSMFSGCTSLTTAPALPATTLANYCYGWMFNNCSALTATPTMQATATLAYSCYYMMFKGCTSLTTITTALNSTELKENCYLQMFKGCTSLTTAPTLSANTNSDYNYQRAYDSMFKDCTSLTDISGTLNAIGAVKAMGCCIDMFNGCTSLTSVGNIGNTYIPEQAFLRTFSGCTSLTSVGNIANGWGRNQAFQYMFSGCTSLTSVGTFNLFSTQQYTCADMFKDCSSLTTADFELPVPGSTGSYNEMFKGCTSLTMISVKANATWDTTRSVDWVDGVAATGDFYSLGTYYPTGAAPSGWTIHNSR